MFSNNLSSIDGVSIFPIISLILFFGVFIVMSIRVMKVKQSYVEEMERIPLNDNKNFKNNSENKNEN